MPFSTCTISSSSSRWGCTSATDGSVCATQRDRTERSHEVKLLQDGRRGQLQGVREQVHRQAELRVSNAQH